MGAADCFVPALKRPKSPTSAAELSLLPAAHYVYDACNLIHAFIYLFMRCRYLPFSLSQHELVHSFSSTVQNQLTSRKRAKVGQKSCYAVMGKRKN